MAKKMVSDGGDTCTDEDAANCLANGHPKAKRPAMSWGMKDQTQDNDGDDDDARSQRFGKGR